MASLLLHLVGHTDQVLCVAFSIDGRLLASAGSDKTIIIWDAETGRKIRQINGGHTQQINSIDFSSDGKWLLTSSNDTTMRIWLTNSGTELMKLNDGSGPVNCAVFSSDMYFIASGGDDTIVRVWDASSGEVLKRMGGHGAPIRSLHFSPNGIHIVSGGEDTSVRIWTLATQEDVPILIGAEVTAVKFSADNNRVAVASVDHFVRIFSAEKPRELLKFSSHSEVVRSIDFNGDGKSITSAGDDKAIIIWRVANGDVIHVLDGHTDSVTCNVFSADGGRVASSSVDKSIRVWKVTCEEENKEKKLLEAAEKGSIAELERLLGGPEPPRVNCCESQNGWTPLHLAAQHDHTRAIQILLEKGANINMHNTNGLTPLFVAFQNDKMAAMTLLIDRGADLNNTYGDGDTLLYAACQNGKVDAAKILLTKGADVYAKNNEGLIALHIASENGHNQIVQHLFDYAVNVHARTHAQETPLHLACQASQMKTAQLLVEFGADPNARTAGNKTAMELCNYEYERAALQTAINDVARLRPPKNNLTSIPLTTLEHMRPYFLDLSGNKLKSDCITTLANATYFTMNLRYLNLDHNPLFGPIPADLEKLKGLQILSLVGCGLSLSDLRAVASCVSLQSIDVAENGITDLPSEFAQLPQLKSLSVARNGLTAVPTIPHIVRLSHLDLSENPIDRLPVSLASLTYLNGINVSGCSLRAIPGDLHHASTRDLLAFLRDLTGKKQAVYRSKLLAVGFSDVGKTTMLNGLFPPKSVIEKRVTKFMKARWEKRLCDIKGKTLIASTMSKDGRWEVAETIPLQGSTVSKNDDDDMCWSIQLKNQKKHEFRCSTALEREDWIRVIKSFSKSSATDGIAVSHRSINSLDIDESKRVVTGNDPDASASSDWIDLKKIFDVDLSIWDFAGNAEYQDGLQIFLTSRSIYLVLWDLTPKVRGESLVRLMLWLVTLQLQLGGSEENSVLIYIIGTHADQDDVDLDDCKATAEQVVAQAKLTIPYKIIPGIDTRNDDHLNQLRHELLTSLSQQSHLGEEVPTAYVDLENLLSRDQEKYRLHVLRKEGRRQTFSSGSVVNLTDDLALPLMRRAIIADQLKLDIGVTTRALHLLNLWGSIVYLGDVSRPGLDELVISAPEWLTVTLVGSLVSVVRNKAALALKKDGTCAVLKHGELPQHRAMWRGLSSEVQDELMQMLYALDLGFPYQLNDTATFADRASVFPQLLPSLPSKSFSWPPLSYGTEHVFVAELNGIPMGFHTALLTRLRPIFPGLELESCWQSGFVFHREHQRVLLTIHDDSLRIRICIRSSLPSSTSVNASSVVQWIIGTPKAPGELLKLIADRYKGVKFTQKYVECPCQTCRHLCHWRWTPAIAEDTFNDDNVKALLKKSASKADLSNGIAKHVHPQHPPHLYRIEDIEHSAGFIVCALSMTQVPFAHLNADTAPMIDEKVPDTAAAAAETSPAISTVPVTPLLDDDNNPTRASNDDQVETQADR